ncbi:hypothetical protein [Sphingomonas sp. CARO-RG-8B-R24-01]|uniref:hypothetical protein n=1 Tax=Sphingomonas sp. CARO-RG-8B-R24-01 TaxID=2914831 RepID=UPI001F560C67|nr:hypothetical protein [Sphingomonas sp. CARO-RG-8B-R24-01]
MDSFKPEPFTEREAFLWSVEQAAYAAHEMWFKGQRIPVERGQFATSIRAMAEAFDWTPKRVRGLMERLGKAGIWAQQAAHKGAQSPTLITVCNYDKYQAAEPVEGTAKGTAKGSSRAQRGHSRGTQQKEGNKRNKEEEEERPSVSSIGEPTDQPVEIAEVAKPEQQVSSIVVLPVTDPVVEAFGAYQAMRNDLVPNARTIELTLNRKRKLADRVREIGGSMAWLDVLAQIRGSPFLRGETSRNGFVAEIDWLLQPANLTKVREGTFDDKRDHRQRRVADTSSPIDAMRVARAALGFG